MTVLVTGGTGFIGARLAARLVAAGERVRCLVRSLERGGELRALGAETVLGDLGAASEALAEAIAGCETVFHAAGAVRAWNRAGYFAANAAGTRRLVEAARAAGARRFLLVSSVAAVGPADPGGEVTEDREPRPVTAYGESKLAAESALRDAAGPLAWTVVRPCAVYGPGDRQFLALFRLARHGFVPYPVPRDSRLSLIHVDDLVDLFLAAAARAPGGSAYLASDGRAHAWPELIAAAGAAVGRRAFSLRLAPALLWPLALCLEAARPFAAAPFLISRDKLHEARQRWVASPAKAIRELGWSPRIGLDEGFRTTAAWYREKGWLR
jgi:nucleoside-diphosphate-sugar epimerase